MKKNPQTLETVGALLFGPAWRIALSNALEVSPRTMRRWQIGEFNIPEGLWPDLADLCERHGAELADVARKLRQ